MEDRRPQQDDAESWKADTGTERPDFLARWLQRRQSMDQERIEQHETEDTEEDDDDAEATIPQRFRKFFRRLVQRVVEPATPLAPPEVPPPADMFLNRAVSEQPVGPTAGELPVETEVTDPYISTPERTWSRVVSDSATEAPSGTDSEQHSLAVEPYQRPLFERAQQTVYEQQADSPARAGETVPERAAIAPAERPVVEERVVERHDVHDGSGLTTVLLGAEYFARRRADKKLERSFERQVKDLRTEADATKHVQTGLEKAVSSKQFSPEAPVAPTPSPEASAVRIAPVERMQSAVSPERTPAPARPEAPFAPGKSREALIPDTDKLAEKHVAPKEVLEKVAEAAEVNAPLERTYERRQEVKDDPNSQQQYGGAAAVGHILSQSGHVPQSPAAKAALRLEQMQKAQQEQAAAYRAAMANGFWGAVAILVLALLAYIATK